MSQREELVAALRAAGSKGVENHDAIYRMGITRAPAIIFELRAQGWLIDTVDGPKLTGSAEALCTYVLRAEAGTVPAPAGPSRAELGRAAAARAVVELPAPAPLRLPCGCVRAADGRSWEERCQKHAA